MFFDILKSEKSMIADAHELYVKCIESEKSVRISPDDAIGKMRTAAELFLNVVIEKNGVKIPDSKDERKKMGLDGILDKINYCKEHEFLDEYHLKGINFARKNGNKVIHPTGEETMTASSLFRSFYMSVASYAINEKIVKLFDNEGRKAYVRDRDKKKIPEIPGYETEDMLPIGEYEVIRPMFDYRKADENQIRAYRCQRVSVIEGVEEVQYAIVRRFAKNSEEDIRQYRDIMAMNEIRRNYANLERPPILAEEITTSDDCDYRYLCYITSKNTFLLSHKDSYNRFLKSFGFETAEQQTYIQLKILREIVSILNDLTEIDDNKSIHHRNLRPHCIFITPSRKSGCKVSIGNFEYSKVAVADKAPNPLATLMVSDYVKKVQNDPYAADEIKRIDESLLTDPDWEQVDVYSAAKLSLYIFFGSADEKKLPAQMEVLKENMSEEFYNITRDIIEGVYPTRPTLAQYLKVIEAEMAKY